MDTKIIPITEFIRRFGVYSDLLPKLSGLVLTREGRPFATLKATSEEKNRELLSFFGLWKGTSLDSNEFWKNLRKRRNRKKLISL
ncbi:hypothetical protein HY086_03685 [Candidatus Gottesmanbacteria bacterium]|nr:hypothetical protein [Candidatus Gottesmanbacteria bacterium]